MNIPVKNVSPQRFLCSTHRWVTPAQIGDLAQMTVGPMCQAANTASILMSNAPVEFHYESYDPTTQQMTLHICVPVIQRGGAIAPFTLRETSGGRFAYREYKGPMSGLTEAWDCFYKDVKQENLPFTGESREVYVKWVAMDSPDNLTELLIGIK